MSSQQLRQELKNALRLNTSITQSIKTLQLSSIELEEYINSDYFDKIENKQSLHEFLTSQISNSIFDIKDKFIALYITDLIDEDGYLRTNNDSIASYLNISDGHVERVINLLQNFEPTGVYARNLQECLKLQLIEKNKFDGIFQIILENLNLIQIGGISKLAKIAAISENELSIRLEEIRKLEPKPARNFSNEPVMLKIPDVKIYFSENGELVVASNYDIIPVVKFNSEYYEDVKVKLKSKDDVEYVNEKGKIAANLVKSVDMRIKTINLVAEIIAKEQEEFFKRGILYLKPLTLSKVAEITGYNESTISRATSNKYVETPFGVLEMKYFFSSGVKSKYSDECVSSHKVKEIIKSLINEEDRSCPLSDDSLAMLLKKFNVMAARRTVTKYREACNIPSSSKRKREYEMA